MEISPSVILKNRFYPILPVSLKRFLKLILLPTNIMYIQIKLKRIKIFNDIIEIAFNSSFPPSQIREEIKNLLLILDKVKPKVILEIGTAEGGTLFLFSNIAHEEAILISVDLYQSIEKRILFRYTKKEK